MGLYDFRKNIETQSVTVATTTVSLNDAQTSVAEICEQINADEVLSRLQTNRHFICLLASLLTQLRDWNTWSILAVHHGNET